MGSRAAHLGELLVADTPAQPVLEQQHIFACSLSLGQQSACDLAAPGIPAVCCASEAKQIGPNTAWHISLQQSLARPAADLKC